MDEKVESSAQGQQPKPEVPPPVQPPRNSPPVEPSGEGEGGKSGKRMSKTDKIMTGATIVIAAFTVVLAGVSYFQWRELRDGGMDTHNLALAARKQADVAASTLCEAQRNSLIQERLADANRVSAERATSESLNATIKNADLDQRAWVGVDRVEGAPALNSQFIVTVAFKNTGKTFAKRASLSGRVESRVTPLPLKLASESPKGKDSDTLIPPNGEFSLKFPVTGEGSEPHVENPTQPVLDQIKAGAFKIYVHGRVSYEDIFRQKHWTVYCFRYHIQGWASCSEHNDADEKGLSNPSSPAPISLPPISDPPPCPILKPN